MRRLLSVFFLCICFTDAGFAQLDSFGLYPGRFTSVYDTLDGQRIADPYRWLEKNDSNTEVWKKSQVSVSQDYDRRIPWRFSQQTYDRSIYWGLPIRSNKLFLELSGYDNALYIGDELHAQPSLLFQTFDIADGRHSLLCAASVSGDRQYVAASFIPDDSLDYEARVIRQDTRVLHDHISHLAKSEVKWFQGGFFYVRGDYTHRSDQCRDLDPYQKVYYHKVGTEQDADRLIYFRKTQPDNDLSILVSYNEKGLCIRDYNKEKELYSIYYKRLDDSISAMTSIVAPTTTKLTPLDIYDGRLYCIARPIGMDNGRIETYNVADPDGIGRIVVPYMADSRIVSAHILRDKIVVRYLLEEKYVIGIYSLDGRMIHILNIPDGFYCSVLGTYHFDTTLYVSCYSLTSPPVLYSFDLTTYDFKVVYGARVTYDVDKYVTEQRYCMSADSANVPVTVIYKKMPKRDTGNSPCVLRVGAGLYTQPYRYFDPVLMDFLDKGGIFVVANIRGGIKPGTDWEEQGKKEGKDKAIADIAASLDYIISGRYSNGKKIAIWSEGSAAVATADMILARPDCVTACLLVDAPFDLLGHERMSRSKVLQKEYGTIKDTTDRKRLLRLSPYHNIDAARSYPALLVMASVRSPFPQSHAMKFVARIQHDVNHKNTCLFSNYDDDYNSMYHAAYPDRYKNPWRFIYNELSVKY